MLGLSFLTISKILFFLFLIVFNIYLEIKNKKEDKLKTINTENYTYAFFGQFNKQIKKLILIIKNDDFKLIFYIFIIK